jgi:predicted HTH transcriptional regulator
MPFTPNFNITPKLASCLMRIEAAKQAVQDLPITPVRAEADITRWVEYFCAGMAESFESVKRRAQESAGSGAQDYSPALRYLDPRQRKALELFRHNSTITSHDVGILFSISDRAARNLLSAWVDDSFVVVADPSKKSRKYGLADHYQIIIDI